MKKNIKKIILVLFLIIILGIIGKYGYEYYIYNINPSKEEIINQQIDEYNFKQLEKVKEILKNRKRDDKQFSNLFEFNKIYNSNIKPIKNCYFINSNKSNNRVLYNFGFYLESNKYINKFKKEYFIYPKYDLPIFRLCFGLGDGGCYDKNKIAFIKTISNPCK